MDTREATPVEVLMQTLRTAFQLRQEEIITGEEYEALKAETFKAIFATLSRMQAQAGETPREGVKQAAPLVPARDETNDLARSAGDLHRQIVLQMAKDYPREPIGARDMERMAIRLVEQKALYAEDMPHLARLIETVCDSAFSSNDDRMMEGVATVSAVNDEVRSSAATSALAKSICEVAHDSAQNVALERIPRPGLPGDQPGVPGNRRSRFWGVVKEDVGGALNGATAAVGLGILGVPAAVAYLGALGPAAAVAPVVGAIVVGGVMSGIEYAKSP